MAAQVFKDPYLFDFLGTADFRKEREVEQALVDHIQRFLLEMRSGFAFVGRQVLLEVGDQDFYLDLLFYHLKLRIDHWRDKEATRDAVRLAIRDFLWSEATGLPVGQYSEDDVQVCADEVYRHVYQVYPTLPSPYYGVRPGA